MAMRILVCAVDFPYPPRGGGRADVWRRIQAFLRLGHEVMLVNLYDPTSPKAPTAEHLAAADQVLAARCSFPIKRSRIRTVRQLANMARLPWHAATRVPENHERVEIDDAVRRFGPDVIWLDGPWFGELGGRLSRDLGVPIAYRSHNVEHLYLKRQAGAASTLRDRVAWRLACVGVKRYELALMSSAQVVFDISLGDMDYWRRLGVTNNRWLPPLPELALGTPSEHRVPTDVLFVGGLRTPNNVQGVRWLVRRVLPIIVERHPDITLGIVGSYPDQALMSELADQPNVRTHFDVPDVTPYQFGARVLVNPVAVGSGAQLKMLDMLMTDAPIITRSQGLSGFPESCWAQFDVADTETEFATAVMRRLAMGAIDKASREEARRLFGLEAIRDALAQLSPNADSPTGEPPRPPGQ